jgi:uncharacterized protein (DUF362 family)
MTSKLFKIPSNSVYIGRVKSAEYSSKPPFDPANVYPEYLFSSVVPSDENPAYEGVRKCLELSGLDAEHFGTPAWNPLGDHMSPGETVLLKPNLIRESHPRFANGWQIVMTQGSVIRAVADYVFKAIGKTGVIWLADAPQTDSSFTKIVDVLNLKDIEEFYASNGYDFKVTDLRREEWTNSDGVIVDRRSLAGDPQGFVAYDLGRESNFEGHDGAGNYYGADYDSDHLNSHHSGGKHEYLISGSAIKADVIVNIPKLKTHKKAGVTLSLKNLVGITGDKNWLPHHTDGSPESGGDEHPDPGVGHRLERGLAAKFRQVAVRAPSWPWINRLLQLARKLGLGIFGDTESVIRSGNWWGNDTIWRMCLDLNRIVTYGGADGSLTNAPPIRSRHLVFVDAVVGGEGSGPVNPDRVGSRFIAFGDQPACVDAACATLMGFDVAKIPIIREAFSPHRLRLASCEISDINVVSNEDKWNGLLLDIDGESTLDFTPHFGWVGHIERKLLNDGRISHE